MNAIVLIALRRPYTFVVLAILILLFGAISVLQTATDIFPPIRIPVIAAVWTYNGLSPSDMSGRIIYYYERTLTTTVSGIEHIESQSYYGSGVVKIYFQPGTDIAAAQAQVTASSQTVIKQLPAGTTPPNILVFDASSVPVLDLQIAAENMTPAQINDITSNLIRPALISVPGVAIPAPYGGTSADVAVDLDQAKLLAHGLTAKDVGAALALQNIVLPAGDQKIGPIDFMVVTNATPLQIAAFNNLPIKQVGNATVYLRDVAYVHEGGPPQQNIVMVKGQQAILLQILKTGDASTLAVVAGIRAKLPEILKTLPSGISIRPFNDASTFVRASIQDVVQEMVTAAILAGLAVLIFVGSWRSTLIVAASIPLSILSSIIGLAAVGQTINVMTLGGLALAVGILVDDATVMIENINSHLEMAEKTGGEVDLKAAIIEASNQIVVPTFVSTTCICIVWLPLYELGGVAGYLFLPLAEAVIFAMIASFILSRTLTPTMAAYLLRGQVAALQTRSHDARPGIFGRLHHGFEAGFERFREAHRGLLERLAPRRGLFSAAYLVARPGVPHAARLRRTGFLPEHQVGRARAAHALLVRHPHRGNREARGAGGRAGASAAARPCHRQLAELRPAGDRDKPGLQHDRDDRVAGLRPVGLAGQPGLAGRELSQNIAGRAGGALPGCAIQLPGRRHDGADPELRPAVADRHPDQRAQPRPDLCLRGQDGGAHQEGRRLG